MKTEKEIRKIREVFKKTPTNKWTKETTAILITLDWVLEENLKEKFESDIRYQYCCEHPDYPKWKPDKEDQDANEITRINIK